LKLLGTNVGVIVLSAGVGNDVVGWILLALCVALVNAGSGLTALWVFLVCVGYVTFLVVVFRPLFLRFLNYTGSLQKGPSQSVVTITILIALASSFFTQVIGVHAIFGGFLIGLLCPHEGGFAIKLTEKIEDLVTALFLPLYFTLSGLQTDLGLLDTGIVWGYVVAVISIAFLAKVAGGALASRACGLLWRESFAIGTLMSCKGLVELIVLVCSKMLMISHLLLTKGLEYRVTSRNLESPNLHHICGHGTRDDICDHSVDHIYIPKMVPG
jgi:Kef-type K+ transport system membrane component KefB